ncbi:hypothetical protein ACFQ3N_07365 [Virgibacillus byunsanensis]|uniref:ABC transporter permease n=1 Tax=Virgibacillus byunsanensis TaxID=570945 RepID=A0ABW3LIL7_9BACI
MRKYLKLVDFELGRFFKIYLVLIAITIVTQIAGVIVKSNKYLSQADKQIYEELIPKAQFLEQYGTMSFMQVMTSAWFMGPIALCIAALIFYIFLIWYRDWFGKNTFIYRLLMLPTARLNVFLAKATSIFLMVLGLISVQLLLLPVASTILKWMVPKDFRTDLTVGAITDFDYLQMLIPNTFIEFVINYGLGFMAVTVLFTAILFERSFRLKGILLGIAYSAIAVIIIISPLLIQEFLLGGFFYPIELLILEVVMVIIVIAGSIWISNYLLNKKIRV